MAVEVNIPAEVIKEEVKVWAAKAPDAKNLLAYTEDQVGLVGDRRVLEVLGENLQKKHNLSEVEVAQAAVTLQAIIQMGERLSFRQTGIADIGNTFADVLVKRDNFREDPVAIQTYRRVASAVIQVSS